MLSATTGHLNPRHSFRARLREHVWDMRDWFDFRPDPHWWPYVASVAAVGMGAMVEGSAFFMLVPIAIVVTLLLGMAAMLLMGAMAIGMALVDVAKTKAAEQRQRRGQASANRGVTWSGQSQIRYTNPRQPAPR